MRRLVAFVVAAAMVSGSLYVRSRLDDDGDDGAASTEPATARVVCSTELGAACRAVGGRVEDAGVTAARLVGTDDPDIDAWIVPAPWPELVDIRRERDGLRRVFAAGTVVATTRLAVVSWNDALQCGTDVSWRCITEATTRGLRPGFPDPSRDGAGLLVLGHVAVSLRGSTDLSTIDFEDPTFDDAFVQLVRAVPDYVPDPLARMLVQGRSAYDVVGVTDAAARGVLDTAAREDEVRVQYPAPMAIVGAEVTARRGVRVPPALRADATTALVAAGWQRGGRPAGVPDAGFLDALVERWEQVRR
jgi:hypothetical protein